jgi:hypothetical protein
MHLFEHAQYGTRTLRALTQERVGLSKRGTDLSATCRFLATEHTGLLSTY